MANSSPEAMFDAEVVAELRRQFQEADTDGSGEIDSAEACKLFAKCCSPSATPEEIQRTADGLRQQMDADRSGTISFNEYCFRFGRRYQMELNRRRRAGSTGTSTTRVEDDEMKRAREELEREREALKLEREALKLAQEREALRREREALEREQRQNSSSGASGSSGPSASTSSSGSAQLPAGTRVRLQGLQAAPELNGKVATVLRFEEAAGRYVVELEGGTQKSLKRESLVQLSVGSSGLAGGAAGFVEKAKSAVMHGVARAQVWVAESGYEWWQILAGLAVVVLIASAWMQASSRHGGRSAGGSSSGRQKSDSSRRAGDPVHSDSSYDDFEDNDRSGRYRREDRREDYSDDGGGYSGGGGGGSGLLGGLLGGGMQTYLIVGGLGFLCWKGIIPVQNLSFFQMMMLWNMLQPMLNGGGGRRRRGGFF